MIVPVEPRQHGFTLVELLVAVLVFSLMAATAYTGLNALADATAAQRERAAVLAELQRAVASLDSDLRQLVSRTGRDYEGRTIPALLGNSTRLLGRRAGRHNPAGLPRSQLQQVRWRFDGDDLVREVWPALDSAPTAEPLGAARFVRPVSLRFRYRDAEGGWHAEWPVSTRPGALPAAVAYVLEMPPYGRIRRVVVL